jgi:predicted nuclease of predicted toxin-antitoxin system
MSFAVKVDEDLPSEIADLACAAGYDARTVYAQGHSGMSDELLWPKIQAEGRMLLTADKGFANARTYPPGSHAGIVLFRLPRESRSGYIRLANFLLRELPLLDLDGAIAVVSPDAIRVHRA